MTAPSFLPHLPHLPGVYLMRDAAARIIYIGKAKDLKKRVGSYFLNNKKSDPKIPILVSTVRHVDYVPTISEREALVLERRLIGQYQPLFNVMWKDDKSYPYVALTMGEDFPRLIMTREKIRNGSLYFGPYPNVSQVKSLLKWVWRKKLFPLRPCKLHIVENQWYPYEKVKSCLYLHTKECPAPCMGHISKESYSEIVNRARWFFGGMKSKIIRLWEKDMKRLSIQLNFEEAARVRDRIDALKHMDERVTFREMTENMLTQRVQESRAVQELMTNLGLKKPPHRIECFDISHIQGVEKVASMVSFVGGRPDKSQYRKFIIKTVQGIDDFMSMAEVIERRYQRLKREGKSYPDLVVVDGGKGQLSAALRAMSKIDVKEIPIVALAKREEEIFKPHESNPIRLEKDSSGLLLLRHIRDEAHRFAIAFHRKRRGKRTFLV